MKSFLGFMKTILIALAASLGVMILLSLLLFGYLYLYEEPALAHFAEWAEGLPRQTEMPVYMSDSRLCLPDGTSFYPEKLLREQYNTPEEIGYSIPVCIVESDLYMVHTLCRPDGSVSWCISSVGLDDRAVSLHYAWENQPAVCVADVAEDFRQRAAWYRDGCIYMNNRGSIVVYDIAANQAEVVPIQQFEFPERTVWADRCDFDADTLYIRMDGAEHALTLDGLSADNPAISEVIERMSRKAVWGRSFADPFYQTSLHTEDGDVWLLVRGVVYGSNTWMLFLRYDAQLQQWLYAGCGYSWDGIPYDYYIIPVVSLTVGE